MRAGVTNAAKKRLWELCKLPLPRHWTDGQVLVAALRFAGEPDDITELRSAVGELLEAWKRRNEAKRILALGKLAGLLKEDYTHEIEAVTATVAAAPPAPSCPVWTDEKEYELVQSYHEEGRMRLKRASLVGFVQCISDEDDNICMSSEDIDIYLASLHRWCPHVEHLLALVVSKVERSKREGQVRTMRFLIRWMKLYPKDFSPLMWNTSSALVERVFGNRKFISSAQFVDSRRDWDPVALNLAKRAVLCFVWFAPMFRVVKDVVRLIVGRIWDAKEAWHTCDAFVDYRWWRIDRLDRKIPTFDDACNWPCAFDPKTIADAIHAMGVKKFLSMDVRRELFQRPTWSSLPVVQWSNQIMLMVPTIFVVSSNAEKVAKQFLEVVCNLIDLGDFHDGLCLFVRIRESHLEEELVRSCEANTLFSSTRGWVALRQRQDAHPSPLRYAGVYLNDMSFILESSASPPSMQMVHMAGKFLISLLKSQEILREQRFLVSEEHEEILALANIYFSSEEVLQLSQHLGGASDI